MMRFSLAWGIAGLIAAGTVGGCSNADIDSVKFNSFNAVRRYTEFNNAPFTNGRQLNGRQLNGRQLNGRQLNGVTAQAQSESEMPTLVGVYVDDNSPLRGVDFVGAELQGRMSDGNLATVKVHQIDQTTVPGMDLFLVKYKSDGEPICGYKDGQPIWATVMSELFDPGTGSQLADDPSEFTFGCRFGGIQKCQEYGYPKDKKAKERKAGVDKTRRFNDYHASCIRMVRADYCGDGFPHTYDGTEIDIYDHLWNNNAPATSTDGSDGFYLEAEWDDDGAHCINKTRWMPDTLSTLAQNQSSANPDWEYIRQNCPERFAYPVAKVGGGMSVPDRACGSSSKWNTSVGYDLYADDGVSQGGRTKLRNNSRLYKYVGP